MTSRSLEIMYGVSHFTMIFLSILLNYIGKYQEANHLLLISITLQLFNKLR